MNGTVNGNKLNFVDFTCTSAHGDAMIDMSTLPCCPIVCNIIVDLI